MPVPTELLIGPRLRLTALDADDLPVIVTWYEDALFGRLLDATPAFPRDRTRLEKWIKEANEADDGFLFGIRLSADRRLIGLVEVDNILWTHGTGWLGYGLGSRADWNQGYGAEAVGLALAFAFRELNLHRLSATVFSYNAASVALLEKLGFRREGSFREFIYRDGQRYAMLLYGLLRREWEAQSPEGGG